MMMLYQNHIHWVIMDMFWDYDMMVLYMDIDDGSLYPSFGINGEIKEKGNV